MANRWYTGVGSPGSALGEDTDLYLNLDTGEVFAKDRGTWTLTGILQGAGTTTPQIQNWHSGAGSPSPEFGENSDFYLDQDSGRVYRKEADTWLLTANLKGPRGLPGPEGPPAPPDVWTAEWRANPRDRGEAAGQLEPGPPGTRSITRFHSGGRLGIDGAPLYPYTYLCLATVVADVPSYEVRVDQPGVTDPMRAAPNYRIEGGRHGTHFDVFEFSGPFTVSLSYSPYSETMRGGYGGEITFWRFLVMRVNTANWPVLGTFPRWPEPAPTKPSTPPR